MSVKYGLEGQVAVVTGAANGFGLAVATGSPTRARGSCSSTGTPRR